MTKRAKTTKVVALKFDDNRMARDLFGAEDRHLRSLSNNLGLDIAVRGGSVKISGECSSVAVCEKVLSELYSLLKKGYPITGADIEHAVRRISRDRNVDFKSLFTDSIFLPAKKRVICPRSPAQKEYMDAIRTHDVVFSIGPAGTGKSYLAVAMACAMLLKKQFRRIVLARPAVEAGEKLGFLPGDMKEKVDPYLRPLYDALYDMLEHEKVRSLMEEDVIEVAPLAFMRGRTLPNSFVIIDEAQNSTYHQMKMCLTRLGVSSKMVVTGDVTQIDLAGGQRSGLLEARRILRGTEGIAFHEFTDADIVRHPVVTSIVQAYQRDEAVHEQ